MTRSDAINKAQTKAARTGTAYIVTKRTAHPAYPDQTVYLTAAVSQKHAWATDERLVFHSDHPDDRAAGWYAMGCPPTSPPYLTVAEMRERAQRSLERFPPHDHR